MLAAFLTIQGQQIAQTTTTTSSPKTPAQNYQYYYYSESFSPIPINVCIYIYLLFLDFWKSKLFKDENTTKITTQDIDINLIQHNLAEIFNGGVFEKDIVLTKSQAFEIFSRYFNGGLATRKKRKVLNDEYYNPNKYNIPETSNSTLWPQEPTIYYMFDGSHSKLKTNNIVLWCPLETA